MMRRWLAGLAVAALLLAAPGAAQTRRLRPGEVLGMWCDAGTGYGITMTILANDRGRLVLRSDYNQGEGPSDEPLTDRRGTYSVPGNRFGERYRVSADGVLQIVDDDGPVRVVRRVASASECSAPDPSSVTVAAAPPASRPAPRHQISVVALSFPPRKPSGAAWDAFGGAPEMRVTFEQDGQTVFSVDAPGDLVSHRFPAAVPFPRELRIDPLHPLVARFVDIDMSANDDAGLTSVSELNTAGDRVVSASTGAAVTLRVVRVK